MTLAALVNTPYPDGTIVYAYDATGYPNGFPGANPPGEPIATAEAHAFSVEFSGLESGVPYIAAGKVDGAWRQVRFGVDASPTGALVAEQEAREEADAARDVVLATYGKGYVDHGAEAGTARPSGFASIEWYGSVEPENAVDGDTWITT